MWKDKFIKAHITKIQTKKRETERYQVGGLGGFLNPAQGMADQRQAAASCQGQWLGRGAGPSPWMGGAPASATWMDGKQINRVGGATGPSQWMLSQGQGRGRGRTYHMDGLADIFCSRRRCSAEAKQQEAVQRLGLASRLQQGTVQQDSLNPIGQKFSSWWNAPISKSIVQQCGCPREWWKWSVKRLPKKQNAGARKRVALEEEDRVKLNRWMSKPEHKVWTMFTKHPRVVYSPCHPFTVSLVYHVINSPSWSMPSINHANNSHCHSFTISSIYHVIHTPCHPFAMTSIQHVIHSPWCSMPSIYHIIHSLCHPITVFYSLL